jgi:multicomponent Na+:H+ antiporter subunit D
MSLPAWAVVIPLAAAVIAAVGGRRIGAACALAGSAGTLAVAVALAMRVRARGVAVEQAIGGWDAPLGIVLRADGTAAVMLVLVGIVATAATAYAIRSIPVSEAGGWSPARGFWPLWLLLIAGLAGLLLTRDLFNVFVALELVTLSAVGLVLVAGGADALTGSLRYLLAAWFGSSLYLLAVAVAYGAFGTLDMVALSETVTPGTPATVALALATAGLAVKAALFPAHFWLPRAHASAPPPVSAMLSALVVTAAFVVAARLWSEAFAAAATPAAGLVVGVLATAGIAWGSLLALRQARLKPLIAYSTVGQMGYLFLLIPLAAVPLATAGPPVAGAIDGWRGGMFYALSHGVAKAALFLAVGSIAAALGSDRLEDMGGIAARLPVTTFAFALAGITLVGLPPSGGFVAKWYLVTSAIRGGQPWWAVVVLGGSLLTAIYLLAVLRRAFAEPSPSATPVSVPRLMEASALALAVLSIVLGLRPAEALDLFAIGAGGAR